MSLLDEIRSDLVNESANLSNTLRKAKILASELGVPEFREWVDFELDGYPNREKVPSYRRIRPTNVGTFVGPFQKVDNVPLPTYNLPVAVRDFAENLFFFVGVGELEAQVSSSSDSFQKKWAPEMVMLAKPHISTTGEAVLVDAYQPVPGYVISGILDQVKNKLLDFVLSLQESSITSEDLDNRAVKPEAVRNLFSYYILGDHNIVASGEHVEQRVTQVQKGDVNSLLDYLSGFNIDENDLSELKKAVASEPIATRGDYGPKVRAWLGGMISKAASRSWDIGLDAASKLLTDALKGYYG